MTSAGADEVRRREDPEEVARNPPARADSLSAHRAVSHARFSSAFGGRSPEAYRQPRCLVAGLQGKRLQPITCIRHGSNILSASEEGRGRKGHGYGPGIAASPRRDEEVPGVRRDDQGRGHRMPVLRLRLQNALASRSGISASECQDEWFGDRLHGPWNRLGFIGLGQSLLWCSATWRKAESTAPRVGRRAEEWRSRELSSAGSGSAHLSS